MYKDRLVQAGVSRARMKSAPAAVTVCTLGLRANPHQALATRSGLHGAASPELSTMCGASPDLLPEVQSATCYGTLALVFTCVTFLACFYWPFGTISVLAGIFGVVGGAMVTCCAPARRQEQTPGFAARMQVSATLFFVGAAAHFIQLILLVVAFIDHLPKCNPSGPWGQGGSDFLCLWHGITLVVLVVVMLFAVVAMAFNIVAGCYCILAKRAILRVGADPPSGEGISTQWREDLQHRGPTTAVAEATVVADCAPVQTVVGIPALTA